MTQDRIDEVKFDLLEKGIYYIIDQSIAERNNYFINLFVKLFGKFPYMFRLSKDMTSMEDKDFSIRESGNVHFLNTYKKIIKSYPDCYVEQTNESIEYIVTDSFIVYGPNILSKDKQIDPRIGECITPFEEENSIYFVTFNGQYFEGTTLKIKDMHDISENYNDDLPDKKIKEILSEDSSSIILLHGIPGSGKTSYIRTLVNTCSNLNFYFLDTSILQYITNTAFIEFVTRTKNAVYILEDCESLLKSRESDFNPLLSTLLNISDGLLGDSLNIKFICTFNTNIKNIDKALLRKGRLKLKYGFKELSVDKVANLFKKLGIQHPAKEMPLCDVYNYLEENGHSENKKKVGFGA